MLRDRRIDGGVKAKDGTLCQRKFGLTKTGEPICLNEYANDLSNALNVQVFLFEDWQSTTCLEPSSDEYIHPEASWQEF